MAVLLEIFDAKNLPNLQLYTGLALFSSFTKIVGIVILAVRAIVVHG